MSPNQDVKSPYETLNHIVGFLHDSHSLLTNCCFISKLLVLYTVARRHHFTKLVFQTEKSLELLKKTLLDPSASLVHDTKALFIGSPKVNIVVEVATFLQFYRFSPFVESLCGYLTSFPPTQLPDLILFFPLLEDLPPTNCHCRSVSNSGHLDGLSPLPCPQASQYLLSHRSFFQRWE